MRDIPELTFRGALSVLGQYDRPVLERLNTALGGVIMVGGVVALTGPVAVPLVGLAAVWGWVDQKNEALGLVRKLLDKVGDYRAASRGYDRTRLLAAANTVLVASSVVEAFRGALGEKAFKALAITDQELSTLLPAAGDTGRKAAAALYDLPVPMPSSGRGYVENLGAVLEWQQRFAADLVGFCAGLVAGQAVRHVDGSTVAAQALRHYQDQYRRLAVQVPEFLVWSMLNEHTATRGSLVIVHEEVKAALADQARAMSRLESLLIAIGGGVPDQVSALHRAVRAGLDEPVVPRDASTMSFLPDVRFPLVREVFVQPHYRCERVDARSRVADEQWWKPLPEHDNLDVRLAAHLASVEATRLPLLVLGHPGAGKSLLMKVLAARLPADQCTTVYVPLRHVSGTAAVYRQIEEGLDRETNGRVDWAGLADQSRATTRVILLDGLDEMLQAADRDRADYLHDVAEFQRREAAQERPVVVLVTSRTLVADRVDVPFGATVVKLEEFSPGQVEQWREVWNAVNRDAIDAGSVRELTHEAVARQPELARQPLLLLMLALYSADLSFPRGPVRADELAATAPRRGWQRLSAGAGSKGQRLYDWLLLDPGADTHTLLVRRSIGKPSELAYYVCHTRRPVPLTELVRVAGSRWGVEETFQFAKNETGLDHYQVRKYDAWYRHITLSMLAAAFLAVTAHTERTRDAKGAPPEAISI